MSDDAFEMGLGDGVGVMVFGSSTPLRKKSVDFLP
jgi:hypothetical protein